jgi:hypothetical protein
MREERFGFRVSGFGLVMRHGSWKLETRNSKLFLISPGLTPKEEEYILELGFFEANSGDDIEYA